MKPMAGCLHPDGSHLEVEGIPVLNGVDGAVNVPVDKLNLVAEEMVAVSS